MKDGYMSEEEAEGLVSDYLDKEGPVTPAQELIDSGAVPRLKGYTVKPGKVSDSIFGGRGSYTDKKTGETVEFENPPLYAADGTPLRLMVRTQRISTHDINRGEIPFKDQILAANHHYMRDMVKDILGTSQYGPEELGMEQNSVVVAAENVDLIMLENVLRMYNAKSSTSTSLYQAWQRGEDTFAGHPMPEGIITNGILPYLMDTPSTKDENDMTVSPQWLFDKGICTPEQYTQIRNSSMMAFGAVSKFADDNGLIFVDTKTEHGINSRGLIVSADELYTLDSSRWWIKEDYLDQVAKLASGEIEEISPRSYSKEFARGFSKGDQGYTDEQRAKIGVRYIMGLQHLTGKRFNPDMRPRDERVVSGLETIVERLAA